MPSSQYKVQQFEWGFRTYDSYTEEPMDGEIARFNVSQQKAEWIKLGGQVRVEGDDLLVTIPMVVPEDPDA
jgi:hypothetical protein